MSIDVERNDVTAESLSALLCSEQNRRGAREQKGMFQQCSWFTACAKENKTLKSVRRSMSQDNYEWNRAKGAIL